MKTRKTKITSVLFIVPAPLGVSPGQRFRFEHYLPFLEQRGIKYKVSPYYSLKGRKVLYSKNIKAKIFALISGYMRRIASLFTIWRYNYIYIHREDVPFGPAFFAFVASRIFRKRVIYDFDDAIWLPFMSDYNQRFSFIKFFGNVARICKWSHIVSVGNNYLKEFAGQFNHNVVVIPTVVNTDTVHGCVQQQETECPAVGWTGSFSTLPYLSIVLPILKRLQEKIDFTFYVIADKDPKLDLKKYVFIKWQLETETEDLLKFHIGLMPLTDDEYSKGKCGFKAIQYMALGMPALVSPVGVNTKIVDNDKNGYICGSEAEWEKHIEQLLSDNILRKKMGKAAREKIEKYYSINSTRESFLNLFNTHITSDLSVSSTMLPS